MTTDRPGLGRPGLPGRPGEPGEPGHDGGGAGGAGGTGGQGGQGGSNGTRRAVIWLFLFSLCLGGINLLFTAHEVNRASAAAASVTQLCQAGNEARAQQVILWTHLVAISKPPPHETPAARVQRLATIRVFLGFVRQVFAPRNCQDSS